VNALGLSQSTSGLADAAIYEGRYSDAVRILESGAAVDLTAKDPERAAFKYVMLAAAQVTRGQPRAAITAAEQALMHNRAVGIRFLAARAFISAGATKRAQELIVDLAKERQPEPGAYAKILEGDMLVKGGNAAQAIDSFTAANTQFDTWIGHLELGRAYLETGDFLKADAEFRLCLKRQGEAISLFLDEQPTYGLFPPVYYYIGRVREGLGTAGFADSYRAYLNIRGNSSEDSLAREARKRAGGV
jgi:tetratricopeptide (TPR) repeat protein